MPAIEVELRQLIIDADTIAENRVYAIILPNNPTYPALTYQTISNQGHHDIPVDFPRIQITAWAEFISQASQLADEVQAVLQRYKGVLNGYRVKQIIKEPSPGDLHDKDAGDSGLYYVPVDYRVIYKGE